MRGLSEKYGRPRSSAAKLMLIVVLSMALFGVIAVTVFAIPCSLDSTGITTCSDHGHDVPMGLVRYLCVMQCSCLLLLTPVILLPETLLIEIGTPLRSRPLLIAKVIKHPPRIFS